jgi:DNA-binding MarR family transcriptional regulator
MRPLGFREAAVFWAAASDPELAFRLHALVGGTPEYKARCGDAGPWSLADLDRWVQQWLLNPASVMFREGGLPTGGETRPGGETPTGGESLTVSAESVTSLASCASVLGAISAGVARPSEIAATLGRPEGAVDDAVAALIALGLIERLQDPLNGDRSVCVIVKPIARLHQLVIAPHEPELGAGQADRVWSRARAIVEARIYRPHFASVARQWCLRHAAEATLGGSARGARPTVIACREHRRAHELEAVFVEDPVATGRVIAIGETNAASGPMDAGQLRRLEHLRALLPGDRVGLPPRLLLFSRSGFAAGLTEESAARADVELVDLERIYRGT